PMRTLACPFGRRVDAGVFAVSSSRPLAWLILAMLAVGFASSPAAAQPTFPACDTSLYLAQDIPTGLVRFDTATNPFVFTPLGVPVTAVAYTGIAFNPADSYLYGIANSSRRLLRIGSDNTTVDLGAITGLPAGESFNAGEIGPDGTYYVKASGDNNK